MGLPGTRMYCCGSEFHKRCSFENCVWAVVLLQDSEDVVYSLRICRTVCVSMKPIEWSRVPLGGQNLSQSLCGILSSLCDAVCVWAESVWNVWQSVWQCQFKRSRVCCRVSAATKATKVLSHQLLADSLAECVWQNPESLETCLWDCGKVHVES